MNDLQVGSVVERNILWKEQPIVSITILPLAGHG